MTSRDTRLAFELEGTELDELEALNGREISEDSKATKPRSINCLQFAEFLKYHYRCNKRSNKAKLILAVAILIGICSVYYSGFFPSKGNKHPPIARREEDRVIYAGAPPPGWDMQVPRQAVDSPHPLINPPIAVNDPYGWMRDETRSNPEVLRHLKDNNEYTESKTKHLKKLKESLYNEMKSFMLETSHSFPNLIGDYYYYRRTIKGKPYPLHVRAPKPLPPPSDNENKSEFYANFLKKYLTLWDGSQSTPILPNEVVYLDENKLADGFEYFDVGSLEISPSGDLVAYTVDTQGNEFYELIIQRFDNGDSLRIEDSQNDGSGSPIIISNDIVWGTDDITLFYTKTDEAGRPYQVFCRTFVNEKVSEEELIFEELESLYYVGIGKTADENYLLIYNGSFESSEVHYIDISVGSTFSKSPLIIADRIPDTTYYVEHYKGNWLINSNVGTGSDMQLWKSKVNDDSEWSRLTDPKSGKPLLDGIPIEGFDVFEKYLVIQGRINGLMQLWVAEVDDDSNVIRLEQLKWNAEPAYSIGMGYNENYNASSILVNYESLTTPLQYVQVDLREPSNNDKRIIVMTKPTPNYESDRYVCDRITVTSRDGKTEIPVSLVYLKSTMEQAILPQSYVPLHLYAYGAYGESIEDTFSSVRMTLVNRGIIYAIAHVRGGGELGRQWYENGKFLMKTNTFNDFIDVGRHFVETKSWTTPSLMSCEGRSAGGLTIGSVLNQAPDLFRVALLGVPFVDLVATMADASIPLTAGEWEEWGNPNEEYFFQYMMDYSPMNNIQAGVEYPSCLIKAGLYDPRVAYWEPLKYTASLRHGVSNDDENRPICLQTDMAAGHFSASDRYKHIRSTAFDYSFLLWQLGFTS
ncbi:unnamed protein product [Pseudo-nitzschia multistriata]|uniref:Prolyl endopeptidase n=1 Tax=Pseudo-nitzschia multistriata TaxID=183589 RepID=A0A448ZEW8_9STRA|nr:unnamed protein product [Pseudo-nitzschia multistriata]